MYSRAGFALLRARMLPYAPAVILGPEDWLRSRHQECGRAHLTWRRQCLSHRLTFSFSTDRTRSIQTLPESGNFAGLRAPSPCTTLMGLNVSNSSTGDRAMASCSQCGRTITRGWSLRPGSGAWKCGKCGYHYCDSCKDHYNSKCPRCGERKFVKADV
jgi:hypothetical protein